MKKEIKIGLLGLAALLILIFGYKYLKGQNLLEKSNVYHIRYANVDMLDVSNPVLINGYKVGSVIKIGMDPENANLIKVTIDVKGEINLPKETVAVLISTGVLGDKAITLEFDKLCLSDCLPSESEIPGTTKGFLGSMMGTPDELSAYVDKLTEGVMEEDSPVNTSLLELQATIKNLNSITAQLDALFRNSSHSINQSLANIQGLTGELNDSKGSLSGSLKNLESFTQQLNEAGVDQLIASSNKTIESADEVFKGLETTIEETNESVANLKRILEGINQGEGTMGQLVTNKSLYERLDRLTQNLDLLLQDVRLNPKRYINVSVFGKKQKEYETPEDDPAFQDEK